MKTIHKIILGSLAAVVLATATPASAYDHHGKYVYHNGRYGYYYGHAFYPYYGGPRPYYYGPYGGPAVVVGVRAPVVVVHRRHFLFFY